MKFVVLVFVVLLAGCAGLRAPKYKAPENGDIAWVTLVNNSPVTSCINIYEEPKACSQKRFGIFVGSGRQVKIKVKGDSPFTYSQSWETMKVRSTRIDYSGNVHADVSILGCMVMNTFQPKKDKNYIVEFQLSDADACQYNIYNEATKQNVKVYERTFATPVWESGDFCEPMALEF